MKVGSAEICSSVLDLQSVSGGTIVIGAGAVSIGAGAVSIGAGAAVSGGV